MSEVGEVRAQRPQPGNRFVSFVRASGRARARDQIDSGYLVKFFVGGDPHGGPQSGFRSQGSAVGGL